MVADGRGELIVATDRDGLFTLRGDGTVSPRPTGCDAFLKEKGLYRLLCLRDGTPAAATDSAGLLLLDGQGRFRNRVDEAAGLHGGNMLSLFEDAEGGLWIGLQAGITRVEVDSPLSILRAGAQDDTASTYTADYWFGTLVVGGKTGLFRVVPADPAVPSGRTWRSCPGSRGFSPAASPWKTAC